MSIARTGSTGLHAGRAEGRTGRAGRTKARAGRTFGLWETVFTVCLALLLIAGLLMIYTASAAPGLLLKDSILHYTGHQLIVVMVGIVLVVVLRKLNYHHFYSGNFYRIVIGLTLLLLLLTAIIGIEVNEARRWLGFDNTPLRIQPSEFAKITILMSTVAFLDKIRRIGFDLHEDMPEVLIGIIAPLLLIFFQPDRGTTAIIIATIFSLVYLADIDWKIVLATVIIVVAALVISSLFTSYSKGRILSIMNPYDPKTNSGQLLEGWYSLVQGGFLGSGLGMSRRKFGFMPEAHTDFIFAIIGEELGFVGCVALLIIFAVFAYAGLRIARQAADFPGQLIAAGSVVLLGLQAVVNVSGILGLMPLTGKPLPFISYGGSSVLSSMVFAGLVLSVAAHSNASEDVYLERRARLHLVEATPTDSASNARHLTVLEGKQVRSRDYSRAERSAYPRRSR